MTTREHISAEPRRGRVIWICGLSGAGKSTVAEQTIRMLREAGDWCIGLDGDELRQVFGVDGRVAPPYDRGSRLALGFQYARLSRTLALQGTTVVVATISLFRELHAWNRAELPGYFEVFLNVPLSELRRRDPKGVYRRFDAGELRDVAGLDLPVDEPQAPDLRIDCSSAWTADAIARKIVSMVGAASVEIGPARSSLT